MVRIQELVRGCRGPCKHPLLGDVRELARAPEDRDDFDELRPEAIDHPEGSDDELAEPRFADFRDDTSDLRKLGQTVGRGNDARDDQVGVLRGVPGDEAPDRLEIIDRARRPAKPGHAPKRRFTSSWGIDCPASSWARPSSILARKTRRSIASSYFPSGGRSFRS